jgi:DNA adenine methylase
MALPGLVGRMGGKSRLKKLIVETYFPQDYESMVYVEPFVGGGSIFFHKNPSALEVINDLDTAIYTIFNGAQKYNHDDVAKELDGIYTKDEFNAIRDSNPTDEFQKFCRIYYIMKKSVMSLGAGWNQTRKKMIVQLQGFKERLEDVIIHNTDYKELIEKYDSDETFFYLDPPYEKSDGLYKHHIININEMYHLLSNIKGKFLMSYNDSNVVREIFKDFNIYEVETNYLGGIVNKSIRPITELLISNYDCV